MAALTEPKRGRLCCQDFATVPHPLPRGHHVDLPLILTLKSSKLLFLEDVPQLLKKKIIDPSRDRTVDLWNRSPA